MSPMLPIVFLHLNAQKTLEISTFNKCLLHGNFNH